MGRLIASFVIVVSSSFLSGAPALTAGTAPTTGPSISVQQSPPQAVQPIAGDVSENWSGYIAESATSYTGVGATWDVPTPSASQGSSLSTDATWVGIGGVKSDDLIQAGTQAVIENGDVQYEAWYELLPGDQHLLPITVHGGDSVTVALTNISGDDWHLSFRDTTTGADYETDLTYSSSLSSAEWIEEMPATQVGRSVGFVPLDNFGEVTFTAGYTIANGVWQTISQANAADVTMAAGGEIPLATPSALADDSFTVERTDASSQVSDIPEQTEMSAGSGYAYGGSGRLHPGRRIVVVIPR